MYLCKVSQLKIGGLYHINNHNVMRLLLLSFHQQRGTFGDNLGCYFTRDKLQHCSKCTEAVHLSYSLYETLD